ncbi:MAG: mannose-6-phosphate isomerase, class I [Treponema sp.]|nr:mannose-6-phosphate isomerase, class I [Treponema sp.]
MTKNDLRIDILGTSIAISADEEPEYLRALLSRYREAVEKVQRIAGLKDPLKIAVLTGFLLCDDLQKAGNTAFGERDLSDVERLTLGMISRLDEVLKAPPQEAAAEPEPEPEPEAEAGVEASAAGQLPLAAVFKLQNTVKHYEWGSPEWIPALLGQKNVSRLPYAELWMGAHPAGPSRATLGGKESVPLPELIAGDPEAFLGTEAAKNSGRLSFLQKVLAAAKPLSIQAHPNRTQAREGFDRENREGIPLDAPDRNYRDSNHKPEILCALTPFVALCGFREAQNINYLLSILSEDTGRADNADALRAGFKSLVSALEWEGEHPLKAFLAALFSLDEEARAALGPFIQSRQPRLEKDFPEYRDEWALCSYLAGLYPRDPGIIAPLYLNVVKLAPGQAIYLPPGVLHAYIHGMGVELMADSDNVLRGGLTSKYVDSHELLRILEFSPYTPDILAIPEPEPEWFTYPAPAEGEFALSVMRGRDSSLPYCQSGASIVLVTEGEAVLSSPAARGGGTEVEMVLSKGQSVFIGAGTSLVFSGTFTAYAASS